jgi:hypothetical protein
LHRRAVAVNHPGDEQQVLKNLSGSYHYKDILMREHIQKNELEKSRKIYFYDNGLRNAVINKWNRTVKARIPKPFTDAYPGSRTLIVAPDNFHRFLTP